ncbi:MAG: DUF222 domain-containing protein [Streptosporangiaceae bacterium]
MFSSGGDVLDRLEAVAGQLATDPAPRGWVAMEEAERASRVIDLVEAAIAARVDHVDADKTVKAWGFGSTSAWLRQACGMRSGRAAERTALARQLRRLPEVAKRFAAGDLGYGSTAAIAHTTKHLSADNAEKAEPILTDLAERASVDEVAKAGGHLRRVLDPDGSLGDDDKGFDRRWFSLADLSDGGSHVEGVLDPELTARLKASLDPLATPAGADDGRSQAQRNADALDTVICGNQLTHMTVIVDLEALLAGGHRPAWLGPTRQPISAEDARRIAANAGLSRLVAGPPGLDTDASGSLDGQADPGPGQPTDSRQATTPGRWTPECAEAARHAAADAIGHLCGPQAARLLCGPPSLTLDVGRENRLVTGAIRRALEHAYPTCAVDGCDIPAHLCEADHITGWTLGGRTSVRDMALACGFHNKWKARHPDRVHITRGHDGRVTYHIPRPGRWPP